jgi:hypothetical protein
MAAMIARLDCAISLSRQADYLRCLCCSVAAMMLRAATLPSAVRRQYLARGAAIGCCCAGRRHRGDAGTGAGRDSGGCEKRDGALQRNDAARRGEQGTDG